MIPKSGYRFSEKIMLRRKIQTVALPGSRHHSRGAPLRPSVAKPCHVKREGWGGYGKRGVVPLFLYSLRPSRQSQEIKQKIKKEMKEAERRQTQGHNRRILRCGARSFGARTLVGVPPRLSPKGIIPSQRLSFRPGFLGRGLHGRYPPSPVPVQGCTSHPGRNAGRHDAQAAREQAANPPAGTALAPMTRCASASCPSPEREL